MFKKILVAILAAQLVITPVQAKQECTKGFVGLDDLLVIFLGTWVVLNIMEKIAIGHDRDKLKKQLEQEKAKQPAPNSCLL